MVNSRLFTRLKLKNGSHPAAIPDIIPRLKGSHAFSCIRCWRRSVGNPWGNNCEN
uniref:Uncharacterized protein n=1 Tax=Erwinia amylovora ATCC BAA-2158 TaxID=889211 RepID=E5BAD6_ERWAM|nr:hypothetical protein predicted by Glimmer/Critica [Erwinia amylovora ATCC BAA-2158]